MSWLKGMREKEPPEPVNPIGTVVMGTLHRNVMDTATEMVRKSQNRSILDSGCREGVSPTTLL